MTVQNIGVYCGASNQVDASYKICAEKVGKMIGRRGYRLIYGGGDVGLMGIVADGALSEGGKVTGIITQYLHKLEHQHDRLTELIVVESMHTRKALMDKRSDAFIVLPGGFGTLDEIFEILTRKQIGLHNRKVIFYNLNGFWDPAVTLIKHIVDSGFAPKSNLTMFNVVTTLEEIETLLDGPDAPPVNPMDKWI